MRLMGILAAALGAVFLSLPALAQNAATVSGSYQAIGYCQMTSLATAKAVATANCTTGSVPANVKVTEICVSTQAVRYRDDGGTPTASIGIPVPAGNCFQYAGPIAALVIIQQSASASVDLSFYGY